MSTPQDCKPRVPCPCHRPCAAHKYVARHFVRNAVLVVLFRSRAKHIGRAGFDHCQPPLSEGACRRGLCTCAKDTVQHVALALDILCVSSAGRHCSRPNLPRSRSSSPSHAARQSTRRLQARRHHEFLNKSSTIGGGLCPYGIELRGRVGTSSVARQVLVRLRRSQPRGERHYYRPLHCTKSDASKHALYRPHHMNASVPRPQRRADMPAARASHGKHEPRLPRAGRCSLRAPDVPPTYEATCTTRCVHEIRELGHAGMACSIRVVLSRREPEPLVPTA